MSLNFFDSYKPIYKYQLKEGAEQFVKERFNAYEDRKFYEVGKLDSVGRIQLQTIEEIECLACKQYLKKVVCSGRSYDIDLEKYKIKHQEKNCHYISIEGRQANLECFVSGQKVKILYNQDQDENIKFSGIRLSEETDLDKKIDYLGEIGLDINKIAEEQKRVEEIFFKIKDEIKAVQISRREQRNMKKSKEETPVERDEKKYKQKLDPELEWKIMASIEKFIEENCEKGEESKVSTGTFAGAYNNWRQSKCGEEDISRKNIRRCMKKLKYKSHTYNSGEKYIGLCFKTIEEEKSIEDDENLKDESEEDSEEEKRKKEEKKFYDSLAKFMEEECQKGQHERTKTGDFVREYNNWRSWKKYPPLNNAAKRIKAAMKEKFNIEYRNRNDGPYYLEISLNSEIEMVDQFREFIKECCLQTKKERINLNQLVSAYDRWRKNTNVKYDDQIVTTARKYLARLNFNYRETKDGKFFTGITTKDVIFRNFISEKCTEDDSEKISLRKIGDKYIEYLSSKDLLFRGDIDELIREKMDEYGYKRKKRENGDFFLGLRLAGKKSTKKKEVSEENSESE